MTLVQVTDLTKRFGPVEAVDAISFSISSGEILGLLGANGAGKTTLIRLLLGLLEPTSGEAVVLGQPAASANHRAVGYVPQGLGLYPELTVVENLEFVAAAFGVPTPELAPPLVDHAHRRVGEIPLGLRRRTAYVAAQCHDPSLLILDEPTSGVGPLGRAELWEMIHGAADRGTGVLVSTHYMEEAEECDRVLVMSQGREVASGSVSEIVGDRRSVAVAPNDPSDIEKLRKAGLLTVAQGTEWRVINADPETVRAILGSDVYIEAVPASFEEAFAELSL